MRVVALTSFERGFASLVLPALAAEPRVDIAAVVLTGAPRPARARQLRKAREIGLVGALNGMRMRRWYGRDTADRLGLEPLGEIAAATGLPVVRSPGVNADETIRAFRDADADVGLSLGTGYIRPDVFEIPRDGMLNVHHELLPEFRGAQSVIWPLHEGRATTGYTIHRIDPSIDGGPIIARAERPIDFQRTLRETVVRNYARSWELSADALREILIDWQGALARTEPQVGGRSFTTPTGRQFARIHANHRRLRRAAGS